MRALTILTALLVAGFAACNLEEALDGAPCENNDDCIGDYTCAFTGNGAVGTCSPDGNCAAGTQVGCVISGSGCDFTLIQVCTTDQSQCFCCNSGDMGVIPNADGNSAVCISAEIARCADSGSCGAGFTCVRTPEQEEEANDAVNGSVEDGYCRPEADATCAQGDQPGCRAGDGCSSTDGLTQVDDSMGRAFCCQIPEAGGFSAHVYNVDAGGDQAACIGCDENACETGTTCTVDEQSGCIVTGAGPCGCTA